MDDKERYNFYSIGFFGCPNFGDEYICKQIEIRLKENYPSCIIRFMSRSSSVSLNYTEIKSEAIEGFWPSPEYYLRVIKHVKAVLESDLILIGGGGLITDKYTNKAVGRYLIDPLLGILLGKKIVFVGLGVLTVKNFFMARIIKFVFKNSVCVYCRDEASVELVRMYAPRANVRLGSDLALMSDNEGVPNINSDYGIVNFRKEPSLSLHMMVDVCCELLKYVGKIKFLVAEKPDRFVYQEVINSLPAKLQNHVEVIEPYSLKLGVVEIANAKFVVATRLHVVIVATLLFKNLLSICYEGKVLAFVKQYSGKNNVACSPQDVSGKLVRRMVKASSVCMQSLSFAKERVQAINSFDSAVQAGLETRMSKYSLSVRIKAFCFWGCLFAMGSFYALGVALKRLIFGRGPILMNF